MAMVLQCYYYNTAIIRDPINSSHVNLSQNKTVRERGLTEAQDRTENESPLSSFGINQSWNLFKLFRF